MECLSGIGAAAAAASAVGAADTFSYNRENFCGDREQRRRASVKVMTLRVEQAKLWRQDVRDLISLTEYKMHMYLIVNVLVLGFTIFLWTEGRLPAGTPHWLMIGNILSIGAAFMFLLLSIWLAMHAAISAQSFEARLLTQMVRLPIPTWEEMEATRTYASEFEKVEARQMFRVPWAMGWQENLVGGSAPTDTVDLELAAGIGNPDIGAPPPPGPPAAVPGPAPVRAAASTAAPAAAVEAPGAPRNVDPWGLEQAQEGVSELGCGLGSQVAKLRHVKLSRQAAIQWQTYDAFSRISMSIGVQQLMQAMSYYVLGYLLVQVGSRTAAVYGVIGFTMMANTTVKFDMTLAPMQLRLAQFLLCLGPVCATAAALLWADFSNNAAEFIVPIAFLSHGLYFALMAAFCRIRVAENGAWLPVAFRSVLYLDVFSWTRGKADQRPAARNASSAPQTAALAGKPALQAVRYDAEDGRPMPLRPEDMAPNGITRDLCDAPGAPDLLKPASAMEGRSEEFYNPASFLPIDLLESDAAEDEDGADSIGLDLHKPGWSEKLGPGELPWRVFCGSMFLVCFVWVGAAVYCIHGAKTNWSLDLPVKELRHPQYRAGFIKPQNLHSVDKNGTPWYVHRIETDEESVDMKWDSWKKATIGAGHSATNNNAILEEKSLSFLDASTGPGQPASITPVVPEQIMLSWPFPNVAPTHITCDATGTHFVMADRIAMYSATIDSHSTAKTAEHDEKYRATATVSELDCPAILGEGLEDVAMSCSSTGAGCSVLALHRHGRRLAACPLSSQGAGSLVDVSAGSQPSNKAEVISDKWLENSRQAAEGGRARSRAEKALSVSINHECKGEVGTELCTVLGTTHGRVVQLGRHSSRDELIPTEVLYEESAQTRAANGAGLVRAFNRRYLGVLQANSGSIRVLDLDKGGLFVGNLASPLSKPVASFCSGGGHVYMLTRGAEPELWKIPVPSELMAESAAHLPL